MLLQNNTFRKLNLTTHNVNEENWRHYTIEKSEFETSSIKQRFKNE